MFFKESHIKELFTTDKEAASKWNGMDLFKRENVLFRLLSKGKVQAYEVTEFRERDMNLRNSRATFDQL